ncbi:MAG TPA: hypothetical protein VFS40_05260 [Gemmatimonadales bacterium]|nr:hypothetical protein [Gemmatimonadales bacterium]
MAAHGGDGQTGAPGALLATAPSVTVTDASGRPVGGVTVTFAVTAGGGTASGTTATTDAGGIAAVGGWTLGPAAGENTLTATVAGEGIAGNPVTFHATAVAVTRTVAFGDFTPALVNGVPHLDGQASVTNGELASVEFAVGASAWYPATTATLPAASAPVQAVMRALPLGSHTVHLRAAATTGESASADVPYTLAATQAMTLLPQLLPTFGGAAEYAITRAELATLLVRLFGQEENARLLAGAPCYVDVVNHWANGNVCMLEALAEQRGFTIGMPDGLFHPDDLADTGTLAALVARFAEVPADAGVSYPLNYIQALDQAGLLPPDLGVAQLAAAAGERTNRGVTAALLYQAWVVRRLKGRTLAQTYVDATLPAW